LQEKISISAHLADNIATGIPTTWNAHNNPAQNSCPKTAFFSGAVELQQTRTAKNEQYGPKTPNISR
jgi:hypothetical protein